MDRKVQQIKQKVNNIVFKIKNKSIINLKYNTQTDANKRKTNLDTSLKTANPTLSKDNLTKISFIRMLKPTVSRRDRSFLL